MLSNLVDTFLSRRILKKRGIFPSGAIPELGASTSDISALVHYAPNGTDARPGDVVIQNSNTRIGINHSVVVCFEDIISFTDVDQPNLLERIKRARGGTKGGVDAFTNSLQPNAEVGILRAISPLYERDCIPAYYQKTERI